MKNKYYLQIIDNLFKSMIEEEKGFSENLRLIQQMTEDIIYQNKFSDYTIERLKEIIEEK